MWKIAFISIGVIISVALSYLPYLQQSAHYSPQYTHLKIEITNSQTNYTNRTQTDRAFASHSQYIQYDETEQNTYLTPFMFTGIQSGQAFEGRSEQAILTPNIMNLSHHVTLKQAKDDQFRSMTTENLIIDSINNLLFSPSHITIEDGGQTTSANHMVGNYKEGWYEFTQQVQSHWE